MYPYGSGIIVMISYRLLTTAVGERFCQNIIQNWAPGSSRGRHTGLDRVDDLYCARKYIRYLRQIFFSHVKWQSNMHLQMNESRNLKHIWNGYYNTKNIISLPLVFFITVIWIIIHNSVIFLIRMYYFYKNLIFIKANRY